MEEAEHISAFQSLIDNELKRFLEETRSKPNMAVLADMVQDAFQRELEFITQGVNSSRPDKDTWTSLVQPVNTKLKEIDDLRHANRHLQQISDQFAYVGESIMSLSWIVLVDGKPSKFVRDMKDAGDYFGNRVLAAHRGDKTQVSWVEAWSKVLTALEQYCKDYHPFGFAWGAISKHNAPGPGGDARPSHFSPPPPPPPPPAAGGDAASDATADRSALFSQINAKGENITACLRPVRKVQGHAPPSSSSSAAPQKKTAVVVHKPKLCLEGRKWLVEHHKDNYALVVDNTDMSESLAMYKCENIGLEIKNKMNGISIDTTKKSSIAIKDVISSVELIRCSDVKIQCNGTVPLINVEKCDCVQIFLTEKSLAVELISSNSTSINICILNDDGTYVEMPVPEQIKSVICNNKLQSTALEKN